MSFARRNLALLLSAAAAFVAAASSAGPLTVEEIVTLRSVATAEMSPDGERIAYVLRVPRRPYVDDDGPAYRELHVTDLEGRSRGYVIGKVDVRDIEWSADGKKIFYTAKRDDDEHVALYEIPIDGGESRRLYAHDTDIGELELSNDGRKLAFLAADAPPEHWEKLREKGFDAEVYEESALPTGVWILDVARAAERASRGSPAASPEGRDRPGERRRTGAGARGQRSDAEEPPLAIRAELPGSASVVRFSPDGTRYAVALAPTPLIDDFYVNRKITIVETETSRVIGRVEHEGKLGEFVWSPDGTRIAFIGAADPNDPLEGRLYVVSADGGEPRRVDRDYPGHIERLMWLDAETLLYVGARGVFTEIARTRVDEPFEIPPEPEGGPIVRTLHGNAAGRRFALVAETPQHPQEVYVWSEAEGYRRLTRSNPILDERDLAPQEVLRYTARDGLVIEGILVGPMQRQPGRRYPVVIAVHGGPESHFSHGWMSSYTFPAQAMAADGFAFFYPNYRASTGRGVEFSKLDHSDPAGREFDDLVDAKAYLVEIGLADPGRVGISGASYGGYASMWGATALTEHFAAAVAFVGLSDLIAAAGTSDIPHELHQVHWRAWPWDDWQFALERSPIYHAGKTRTPLLILGGDADPRVDPSQSLALYRHIKLRTDTPVRLVRYPGEQHGNRDTAAQLDYALRMQRWMKHYLQGPGGEPPPYELDVHVERLGAAAAAQE